MVHIFPQQLRLLAVASCINMAGFSFIWPLTSAYVTVHFGRSLTFAGFLLTCESAAGIAGSMLGGSLFDKWGAKKTLLISAMLASCALLTLLLWYNLILFISMMILLNFCIGVIVTGINALAGTLFPSGDRKAFDIIYIANNLGVAFGTSLGGWIAERSFSYSFLLDSAAFVVFLLIASKINFNQSVQSATEYNREFSIVNAAINRRKLPASLIFLCIGLALCLISYIQWQSTISVYMNHLGYSLSSYSLLWTINGILILTLQPFLGAFCKRCLPTLQKQLYIGVILYMSAFLVLSLDQRYVTFVVAMVVLTLGEMLVWPAVPATAAKMAPAGREGFFQGILGSANYAGRMIGPTLGGYVYDHFSPNVLLLTMAMIFLCALFCFTASRRKQDKKPDKNQDKKPDKNQDQEHDVRWSELDA